MQILVLLKNPIDKHITLSKFKRTHVSFAEMAQTLGTLYEQLVKDLVGADSELAVFRVLYKAAFDGMHKSFGDAMFLPSVALTSDAKWPLSRPATEHGDEAAFKQCECNVNTFIVK